MAVSHLQLGVWEAKGGAAAAFPQLRQPLVPPRLIHLALQCEGARPSMEHAHLPLCRHTQVRFSPLLLPGVTAQVAWHGHLVKRPCGFLRLKNLKDVDTSMRKT